MLCRRILDGTVTSVDLITLNKTTREIVSQMKSVTNKMGFRSPNYNPAGLRKANKFEDLITIMDADFEGKMSTEVLATSYFRGDAELKTNLRLTDGFSTTDEARLAEVLGDAYVAFTSDEKTELAKVKAVVIAKEWFMDYDYQIDAGSPYKETEFYNPTTLERNVFLHYWGVKSTSPFEQAVVFISDTVPAVSSVTVSPSSAVVNQGQELKLSAEVATVGFANKAVSWSVVSASTGLAVDGVTITQDGVLKIGASVAGDLELTVKATSVFNSTKYDTATISTPTVAS